MNASERGKSNRRRGLDAERAVARYLRTVGFPGAERAVRTGFNAGGRTVADPGDITGIPGVVIQIKSVARENIAAWMEEVAEQSLNAESAIGILVQRRPGKADAGRWWAWVMVAELVDLTTGAPGEYMGASMHRPVRMELGHLVPLLRQAGYGTTEECAA
ncbi:hypothetical protein [Saccharopolyspora sp. NPDC002376]